MARKTMQDRRTGFRPNIEARPPHNGMRAVAAKGYALPAHMKLVPCKSSTIVGSVVDTAVYDSVKAQQMQYPVLAYQVKGRKEVTRQVGDEQHPERKSDRRPRPSRAPGHRGFRHGRSSVYRGLKFLAFRALDGRGHGAVLGPDSVSSRAERGTTTIRGSRISEGQGNRFLLQQRCEARIRSHAIWLRCGQDVRHQSKQTSRLPHDIVRTRSIP